MSHRTFIALCALILIIAAGLRLSALPSYPPGPHYDEAVYLQMTRSIAFGGARFFPIVEAYQGREVLWMYLNAPLLTLFGDGILTLRYASVFANLLTLALCIGLARAIFRGRRGRMIALAAGAAFALSFPQIWLARQAFRAVTLPLCQAAALWLLWRGLRAYMQGKTRAPAWMIAAGVAAGGAIYTYMASRLFPLWIGVGASAAAWWMIRARRATMVQMPSPRRVSIRARDAVRIGAGIAVFLGVMLLTMAPMIAYALEKPDIFFGRLAEVTRPDESVTLIESIALHARMFFIEGDPYVRYNVPQRPYFTLPEGVLLVIGLAVCLVRVCRRRIDPAARAGYLLALLSPLMILPSVISVGGLPPSHMRSLGMVPLIFIAFGVGAEWVWVQITARTRIERAARGFAAALTITLMIGALSVGTLYFDWARRADVYYETDADLAAAARWLADGADGDLTDTVIYLAARDKGHPTAMIEAIPPVRWIGTDTLFRAPPNSDGVYVFPRSAPPPDVWRAWLEPGRLPDLPLAPDGRTAFEAFRLSGTPPLPASSNGESPANPYLRYVGMDRASIPSGESGWITTYWMIEAPPPFADLTPLLEIVNDDGRIARGENYMTETDRWLAGEVLILRTPITVPPGLATETVTVRVAWIARATDTYIPYTGGGIWADAGTITLEARAWLPDLSTLDLAGRCDDCTFGDVRLLGWDALPTRRPGERARVVAYWRAEIDDPDPPVLAIQAPLTWESSDLAAAFARMARGEVRRVVWEAALSPEMAAGAYPLALIADGQRVEIGALTVQGIARVFDPPRVAVTLNAVFGGVIALYGYTLTTDADGLTATLVWRADQPIERDYTVFVHRLDAAGAIIDQRDSQPGRSAEAAPTSLWQPGEYVTDTYQFPHDDRAVALRIGLYMPDDGVRLLVSAADFALIPLPRDG
jgi:hypothetical protein